jgi:hypothetical protein
VGLPTIVALVPPETLFVHVDPETVEASAASRFSTNPLLIGLPLTKRPRESVVVAWLEVAVVDSIALVVVAVFPS